MSKIDKVIRFLGQGYVCGIILTISILLIVPPEQKEDYIIAIMVGLTLSIIADYIER